MKFPPTLLLVDFLESADLSRRSTELIRNSNLQTIGELAAALPRLSLPGLGPACRKEIAAELGIDLSATPTTRPLAPARRGRGRPPKTFLSGWASGPSGKPKAASDGGVFARACVRAWVLGHSGEAPDTPLRLAIVALQAQLRAEPEALPRGYFRLVCRMLGCSLQQSGALGAILQGKRNSPADGPLVGLFAGICPVSSCGRHKADCPHSRATEQA